MWRHTLVSIENAMFRKPQHVTKQKYTVTVATVLFQYGTLSVVLHDQSLIS